MILNFEITRARKVVEVTLARSRQREFEPESFLLIAGAVPEILGDFNFETTGLRR